MAWPRHASPALDAGALDTVFFDVDGVLIDTSRSYRLAVIHAVDRLVRGVAGLADAPRPLLTPADIAAFKVAGGFNNDWDLTWMLTALWTARLREWRGTPPAAVDLAEWAARAGAAARAGRGGLAWMGDTFPASAIPPADVARWAEDEFYWGAALVRQHYGHEPRYAPEAPGFVHNEALLLPPGLLATLAGAGVAHLGLITGRVGPEVPWAVRRLVAGSGLADVAGAADAADARGTLDRADAARAASPFAWHDGPGGRSPFAVIVTGDDYAKPDPRALAHAARAVGARGGLYVGDTADDLDLVLRYRAELLAADPALPPFLAVAVAAGPAAEVLAARGADAVIPHVSELPAVLAALRAAVPEPAGGQDSSGV